MATALTDLPLAADVPACGPSRGSARERELVEGVEWGYAMIKALVNHAGGEVVLDKETVKCTGRLEVIPHGDKIYVRCWKGMNNG